MAFEVLPAIDVAGGRLVSVSEGRVDAVEAFGGSPVSAARAFVEAGATWLHVVDVDRAQGREPDLGMVGSIVETGAAVQASGGIESESVARAALQAGATRVVLGSAALTDPAAAAAAIASLGERSVVGIEADGDAIRPRSIAAALPLDETLAWLREVGAPRYLYTDVSRVAGLAGPDVDGVRRVARALGRPVLAAGGIRGVDDVLALRNLGPDVIDGVVIGRALSQGLDLRQVLREVG